MESFEWALSLVSKFDFGFGLGFYFMNLFLGLEWADGIFLFWALFELGLMRFGLDCVSLGLQLGID